MSARVAVVSGAAGGIGRAVVARLLREATVVALDINDHALADLPAPRGGLQLHRRALDITDAAAVQAAITEIDTQIGPITDLVNAAGILHAAPVLDLTPAALSQLLAVNTLGVFHLSQAVAQVMAPRRAGAIVTITSNAARTPRQGLAGYGATKAAAEMITHVLGLELARDGIRCNTVAPGSTDTPMLTALWPDTGGAALTASIEGVGDQFRLGIPLGRIAAPTDIADAVAFLLSTHARHITMHRLTVDGGATLGAA